MPVICDECGEDIPLSDVEEDGDDVLCESCAETEWSDLDFPLWIDVEHYEDNWEMVERVNWATGIDMDKIPSDEMKYTVFSVWFKITEGGLVKGPYDEKRGEKI